MIERTAKKKLQNLSKTFPAIAVVGPRQSGKTTLVKETFPQKPYVLLEDPDTREFAQSDPKGFLAEYPNGAILDEIQRVPELFSYLQGILDRSEELGLFILTGSQNFLMMEKITQSLAGRIAFLTLLPLSFYELQKGGVPFDSFEEYLIRGFYPRVYHQEIEPRDVYSNYVKTYIERDIRLLKNIQDLSAFHTFIKLCAHRNGQLLNFSALADDCGIKHNTAKSWLSLLESSYIIHFLQPHHKNLNKRLIKTPKMYFIDPGLAAYLADIENKKHLLHHPLRGALFESFIISELLKYRLNVGEISNLYFWRDKLGREIDCIVDRPDSRAIIEIKSGKTASVNYFDHLRYYAGLSKSKKNAYFVVYGGDQTQRRTDGTLISWKNISQFSV